jgi:hypothetical protein
MIGFLLVRILFVYRLMLVITSKADQTKYDREKVFLYRPHSLLTKSWDQLKFRCHIHGQEFYPIQIFQESLD